MPPYPQNPARTKGRPKSLPPNITKHLKAVTDEVTWLTHFHEVFRQFNDIVRQSPVNNARSDYWNFVKWAFLSELVHRVDRICEDQWRQKKKRVHSLAALLQDLEPHVDLLNRDHYIAKPNTLAGLRSRHPDWADPGVLQYHYHRLNREFDRVVGRTKFAVTKGQINRDLKNLKRGTKRITHYRNKHLAHMAAKRGRMRPPNFTEVTAALQLIRKLTHKYFLLIKIGSHTLNLGNVDITGIFMQSWITGAPARDALRAAFRARAGDV